ncbi:unnamed protein product [Parnassius apollo]|uniref:(apollo) hypothetical protein n=1 Tax=Parnassius apollo TaxID=110799 RepID=A0A8S3W6E5_PARAO|nr:unnamed protein product [Parnassius apollo]
MSVENSIKAASVYCCNYSLLDILSTSRRAAASEKTCCEETHVSCMFGAAATAVHSLLAQLAALRNRRATENLEWTCEVCCRETPRQRSFVIQEEEEEDDEELLLTQGTDSGSNAMKKLLSDISFEVKKAVKKEIGSVNEALSSCCQKMDGIMDTLVTISGKIKELENKNTYLTNQNKHLELKIDAME